MALTLTYEMTCDFCGVNIGGKDVYTLAPYAPAQDMRLPAPRTNGRGLGEWMACDMCLHSANDVNDLSGNIKKDIIKEFFTTSIEEGTNRLLSEDYHFCNIWRKIGGKVWAAPWCNLAHVGSYVFEGQLLRHQ